MNQARSSGVASLAFADLPASASRPAQPTRRLTARLSGKEGWCLLVGLLLLSARGFSPDEQQTRLGASAAHRMT
jgi:hypothetical protein